MAFTTIIIIEEVRVKFPFSTLCLNPSSMPAGLLTEIQCKSKRLRKKAKVSPGQSTGDETEGGDNGDSKQVTSTTKLSKVKAPLFAL